MTNDIFLISGATGTIGRQITNELLKNNSKVRVITRALSKSQFSNNVEVFEGDLNKPDSLKEALVGVKGIHLISFGDEHYTPLSNGKQIVEMLEKYGVKQVTILWNGEGNESSLEQAIKLSDLDWTILQPQEYMANALGWRESIITQGVVKEPFGNRPTAVIHEADIGAVIATILMKGGHTKRIYTLTGPQTLSPKKQVQTIEIALGQKIDFIELDESQTRARWKEWGLQEETMNYLYDWYGNTPTQGYTVTAIVEEILKRQPKSFEEWVAENINYFRK